MNEVLYVIGFDLNDSVSQISYVELNEDTPRTLAEEGSEKKLGIPTVLCKRNGVAQWFYGTEALNTAERGDGVLASKLLGVARAGGKYEIEGEAYDAAELLVLFVRRTLTQLSGITSPDQVASLVFCVDALDKKTLELLNRIIEAVPIDNEKICFQTYAESCYYYMIHQPESLWEREVTIFDYSVTGLHGFQFRINRKTTPNTGFVDEFDMEGIRMPDFMVGENPSREKYEELDEEILVKVHEYFNGKSIGTVYLLGDGFEPGWCTKTIRYMCMGRRVFQGKNLYSKGACFFARDKLVPSKYTESYVFLGRNKLKFNLGIYLRYMGQEEYVAIADGGENWFDCDTTIDMLLDGTGQIVLLITPLDGKDPAKLVIELEGLPERPRKASRIRLKIKFNSETSLTATAIDMGFGEIFPSSGLTWEKSLKIG
ncbi:MAG TPA: hypothetical protein DCL38_03040 [Lachnospiraceae bacterium]|nr:hypothetical protein [Lachnospiraceae bacterium]